MNEDNVNKTVENVVEEGRKIVKQANKRHVIIRNADGTTLIDLSLTVFVIILAMMFFFQPIGIMAAAAAIAYGLYAKVKVEVVHELSNDEIVEINIAQEDEE